VCGLRGVLKNSLKLLRGRYAQNLVVTSHLCGIRKKRKILRRKKMKKKLTILIPLLALFIFLAIAGTITVAGSGTQMSPEKLQSLEAQKQVVLDAIAQRNQAKADMEFELLVTKFAKNKNIAEALYRIGFEYQNKYNKKNKATEIYMYNTSHFSHDSYALLSQVEIIRRYIREGSKLADNEVEIMLEIFRNQPDLPKSIYQIGQFYTNNKKKEQGIKLFQYAANKYPDEIFGQLSQIKLFLETKEYDAADIIAGDLFVFYADNAEARKGLRDLASFYRDNKEYERSINIYMDQITEKTASDDPIDSYRELIYTYIDMNNIESADEIMAQMQTDLADNPRLARTIFNIGNHFLSAGDSANAIRIHKYNVEHYTDVFESMWSQAALVWYYVRHNDQANADIEYANLLKIYQNQKTLPKEVFQIGDIYLETGDSIQARSLYNQVMEEWPESQYVFNAKAGFIKADIHDGNDEAAMIGIDGLITDYIDRKELPPTVFLFGEQYWKMAVDKRREELPQKMLVYLDEIKPPSEKVVSNYLSALEIWEKAITNFPDSQDAGEAAFMTGEVYNAIGSYDEAIQTYTDFIDTYPDLDFSWVAQDRIIKIYKRIIIVDKQSDSETEKSLINAYEKLIRLFPDCLYAESAKKNNSCLY
jgi:tetratricopeptide (TPR) repeat protein